MSPYKPGQTVFPLPPAGMTYPGYLASLRRLPAPVPATRRGARPLPRRAASVGAQLAAAAAGSLGCSKPAGSSPLAGASPPSVMTASLCRDLYCLSYHCASHLAGAAAASASCAHDPAAAAAAQVRIPAGVPHALRCTAYHRSPRPRPPAPHRPLWPATPSTPTASCSLTTRSPTSATGCRPTGPCDKRFATSEELLSHQDQARPSWDRQTAVGLPQPSPWPAPQRPPSGLPHAHPHVGRSGQPRDAGAAQPPPRAGTQQPPTTPTPRARSPRLVPPCPCPPPPDRTTSPMPPTDRD